MLARRSHIAAASCGLSDRLPTSARGGCNDKPPRHRRIWTFQTRRRGEGRTVAPRHLTKKAESTSPRVPRRSPAVSLSSTRGKIVGPEE